MRRILVLLAGLAVVWITEEGRIRAQSSTASLAVSATVSKNCTITTAPVNFGAYDPVTANNTAPLDGLGTVTVTCTKGAVAKVGLGLGSNAQGTTRRMSLGAASYLSYELYSDSSHTTIWGTTTGSTVDLPAAPNKNPRDVTVYGRVGPAQDATVGAYADTVVATVNF